MNRFKKELKKKGVKLENDYPTLPYDGIQCVTVIPELAQVGIHHTSISIIFQMNRSGELEEIITY